MQSWSASLRGNVSACAKQAGGCSVHACMCCPGVAFSVDDTLPGAVLHIVGQNLALSDSLFANLASGA